MQNQYTKALTLFLAFFLIATLIDFLMKRYGKKLIESSEHELVGKICEIIHSPTYFLLVITGLYFGAKSIPMSPRLKHGIEALFFVLATLTVARMMSKTSNVLVTKWLKVSQRYKKTPELINKIVSVIIYIIALLVILDHFNIEISPIIATLGLGGLAVGLALQDTLKDFFAGLHIISDQPIRVGDHIELEGQQLSGYVEDIGWRSTRIRTLPNNYVIVPNSKLAASTLVNHNMPQMDMKVRVQVGVDYTSDLDKVEDVTIEVAKEVQEEVEGAVKDFEPFIRFHTFGDNNINFTVILQVEEFIDQYLVTNEFVKRLHDRYKEEDIEISWPIRKVYELGEPEEVEPRKGSRKESASKKGFKEFKEGQK